MRSLNEILTNLVLPPIRRNLITPAREAVQRVILEKQVQKAPIDPAIEYPCYKSLDDLIDVKRLKSLNDYVLTRIKEHRKEEDEVFYSGFLTLKATDRKRSGSRIIALSKRNLAARGEYQELNKSELWTASVEANEFEALMEFISTLPFKSIARAMIMYDETGRAVTPHRDHSATNLCHEFIWFRTNLDKPFYMLNPKSGEKKYVSSYSAWFDSVNQFHGADAHKGMSFSIRVDGTFTDAFRNLIPIPKCNPASTAALWACVS